MPIFFVVKFGQAITDNAANEPSRMGHQRRQMFGVTSGRLLPRARNQQFDEVKECSSVVIGNCAVRAPIVLIWAQRSLRDDRSGAKFFSALIQPKLNEVTGCPAREFLKSLKLIFVLRAPTCRIGRFIWCLKLNKSPGRCTLPYKCNIRPADAGVSIFWDDNQPRRHRQ